MLGFFGAQVEFQEDVNQSVVGLGPGLDGFQEVKGVYGLGQGDVWQDQFEFIGLEMADEMPLDIGRKQGHLGRQFLRTVFSKHPLACVVGLQDGRHRVEFGNSHQSDVRRELLPDNL